MIYSIETGFKSVRVLKKYNTAKPPSAPPLNGIDWHYNSGYRDGRVPLIPKEGPMTSSWAFACSRHLRRGEIRLLRLAYPGWLHPREQLHHAGCRSAGSADRLSVRRTGVRMASVHGWRADCARVQVGRRRFRTVDSSAMSTNDTSTKSTGSDASSNSWISLACQESIKV